MPLSEIRLRQLDDLLQPLHAVIPPPPRNAWLRAIREALGMTTRQVATRVGVTQPSITDAEKSEAAGTMTLAQLRRLADALDCELRYVLLPRTPLADQVDAQAERKAREQIANVSHTMALESQGTGSEFQRRQIADVKGQLLRGRRSRLWE